MEPRDVARLQARLALWFLLLSVPPVAVGLLVHRPWSQVLATPILLGAFWLALWHPRVRAVIQNSPFGRGATLEVAALAGLAAYATWRLVTAWLGR